MTASEVVSFILPQADDLIQISFLLIIAAMIIGTVSSAWWHVNEASWERKWNRGTLDDTSDGLDIEHGSVTDLWHAVATAPEKAAEVMPGMLLVIGLLGTFLGLGLALNKASSILSQSDAISASAAADSMNHLMGLLQGLGTKFKTSTWGIAGFVLLKIWNEAMRYEEKRMAWVIGKVKTELEKRKQDKKTTETKQRNELHAQIALTAHEVVAGLNEQFGKLFFLEKEIHQKSMVIFDAQLKGLTALKAEITDTSANLASGQIQQVQKLHEIGSVMHQQSIQQLEANREILARLNAEVCSTKESMLVFTQNTQNIVEQMAGAAQQMAGGAKGIGEAAMHMAQGADQVGTAGQQLIEAIDDFKEQFTSVLDDVRKDLGKSIQDMSAQASSTLEKGSERLSSATSEISTALGILSQDVNKTMTEVKDSIEKALDIQQRASNEFTISAGNLNENISATTNIVGELAHPIKDGLRSVSEAGQHMRSIGKSLDKSLSVIQEVIENLKQIPDVLQPVFQLHDNHQQIASTLRMLDNLPDGQKNIIKEMQGLRIDLKSAMTTQNTNAIQLATSLTP